MSDEGRWELPEGWEWASANRFARVVGGGTPANAKDTDNYASDGIPWITPADLSGYKATHISAGRRSLSKKGFASSSARVIPKGSVLLSSRAPVGYCVVAANDISTNQGFKSFVLKSADIQPEFLRYYLIGSKRYLESESSGTTFLELSGGRAEQLVVPIAPRKEQKRIVSKIDELYSSIEEGERALERARKLVEHYRQSVLKAAVTGELTRSWREKHASKPELGEALIARILAARRRAWEQSELDRMRAKGQVSTNNDWKKKYTNPAYPDVADSLELPRGWAWSTLDILAAPVDRAIQSGPFGSNLLHSEFQSTGMLVIGIDNVREGWFSQGSQNRISPQKFEKLKKYVARPRDFLITIMATIGRTCVVPDDIEPAIITKHVYRFTLNQEFVIPEFVNLCVLGHPLVRNEIFGNVQGQTRPGLNKDLLIGIRFPLPPIEEQRTILDTVSTLLSDISAKLNDLVAQTKLSMALRQSALNAAFSGKLVPQDPTDEPASLLLERLVAERSASPKHVGTKLTRKKKAKA